MISRIADALEGVSVALLVLRNSLKDGSEFYIQAVNISNIVNNINEQLHNNADLEWIKDRVDNEYDFWGENASCTAKY
jgi:hypothetical protein